MEGKSIYNECVCVKAGSTLLSRAWTLVKITGKIINSPTLTMCVPVSACVSLLCFSKTDQSKPAGVVVFFSNNLPQKMRNQRGREERGLKARNKRKTGVQETL